MDTLQSKIEVLLDTEKPLDTYISLLEDYNDNDIELAFLSGFNISFTTEELELKEVRKKQAFFRKKLIDRYEHCIITGSHEYMCEACHIIPHNICTDEQKYDINNGLLLNAGVHKLFDRNMIGINPVTSTVELSTEILTNNKYRDLHQYNKQKLALPKETLQYIKRRNELLTM